MLVAVLLLVGSRALDGAVALRGGQAERLRDRYVLHAHSLGDGGVGDRAAGHVDAGPEAGILGEGALDAVVGEREDVGKGRVGERVGRGDRHGSRHVGDAVVGDPVDLVDRVAVRRRLRGLEAAALVDGDVDEHGVALHQGELVALDHVRGAGALDEHGADHQVHPRQHLLDRERRAVDGRERPGELQVGAAQRIDVEVEEEHVRRHPDGDLRGVDPDRPGADHHHVRRRDPGHAAEQDPAPAHRLLEEEGAGLSRQPARDLAHRGEQRQVAVAVLDRLVGDAGRAGATEAGRQLRGRSEMQVGEERLLRAEHLDLVRLRFLDAEHHVGLGEHVLGGGTMRAPCAS